MTQPGNEGLTFRFRIQATNELGISVYSDEIRLVATDPPGTPVLSMTETARTLTSLELVFDKPVSDGGAPVIGFLLYQD